MNNAHPDEPVLLALADDELERSEAAAVREHVESCSECRQRIGSMRSTLEDFSRLYAEAPVLPPPRPWVKLPLPSRTTQPLRFPRWAFAVAAAAVALVLIWKVEWTPKLNAAELLRKAVAANRATPPQPDRNIRVRTRGRAIVRPASLRPGRDGSEPELRRLFTAANYSWDEPLAVTSYVAWREQLPQKDDAVETINPNGAGAIYRVRTTTNSGPLAEATLSLRAGDLHPVEGTFRFGANDLVEISEMPEADAGAAWPTEQPAPAGSAVPATAEVVPPVAGPDIELRALAALHGIGADLGEPIDVERSGSRVTISGSGIGAQRQQQVREALSRVPGVELKFDETRAAPRAERRRTPDAPVTPPEINRELAERLGGRSSYEQFVNSLLDASDAALARAHSLRGLAQRFTPEIEQQLTAADRAMLAGIRRDHTVALARHVVELRSLVNAAFPELPEAALERAPAAVWQQNAQQLLGAAQRLDELVNRNFAAARGGKVAETELDAALRRLEAVAAAARRLD